MIKTLSLSPPSSQVTVLSSSSTSGWSYWSCSNTIMRSTETSRQLQTASRLTLTSKVRERELAVSDRQINIMGYWGKTLVAQKQSELNSRNIIPKTRSLCKLQISGISSCACVRAVCVCVWFIMPFWHLWRRGGDSLNMHLPLIIISHSKCNHTVTILLSTAGGICVGRVTNACLTRMWWLIHDVQSLSTWCVQTLYNIVRISLNIIEYYVILYGYTLLLS